MHDRNLSINALLRLLLLPICVLFLFEARATAGPTAPDDGCLTDSVCRIRYDQAVKLFEVGHFENALSEFQAAYARRQMPWLLINIGRTLHRLGRPREALDYYERFKQAESRPDSDTQERLEKYIAQARALAEKMPPPPQAVPPGNPDGASPAASLPSGKAAKAEANQKTDKPLYKKWWFWTALAGGVVAVAAIGVGIGVGTRPPTLPGDVQRVMFNF